MQTFTATYSPDDNKLRLYSTSRLDSETFARVKAAGFKWAPKQGLFVAPMWTPHRVDLLVELCGEIEDEDKSLVDRAEERAERFDDYSEKRARESKSARDAVSAIADGIPFGQPILVGHHSERRARKDAERIENGMRRAVKLWETSTYWQSRARGALAHAKYKERPDVRARRIKNIEADRRKRVRELEETQTQVKVWGAEGLTDHQAQVLAGRMCGLHFRDAEEVGGYTTVYDLLRTEKATTAEVAVRVVQACEGIIAHANRWIEHYDFRLQYEAAMLGESGGLQADQFALAVGGRVLAYGEWLTILRLNKSGGRIVSVTTTPPSCFSWQQKASVSYELIKQYQAPTVESAAAAKTPPLVNCRSEGCTEMTKAAYKALYEGYKGTRTAAATGEHGAYRYRVTVSRGRLVPVYLTDSKVIERPEPNGLASPRSEPAEVPARPAPRPMEKSEDALQIDQLRQTLQSGGVQVAVAPQLFPTPAHIAARMVDYAEIEDGMTLLEPSAGTGALLDAVRAAGVATSQSVVEINAGLAQRLRQRYEGVRQADFLQLSVGELGRFDRVLMNPPFANAADIEHIRHAFGMLKPGGVLVAICANGPRQNEQLRRLAEQTGGEWEELPADTFKEAGTSVRTALLTLRAAA